jgi:hypothetical protein
VKVAGSIAAERSAARQSQEFAAKLTSATSVKTAVRAAAPLAGGDDIGPGLYPPDGAYRG